MIFLKISSPIYAVLHPVTLGEKHKRSSTVQEEELTIEGRHHLLLLHKQTHDKKSIAESLYVHTNKARLTARLTACEVGIFYHNSRNYTHPLFEEPLKFIAHEYIYGSWFIFLTLSIAFFDTLKLPHLLARPMTA